MRMISLLDRFTTTTPDGMGDKCHHGSLATNLTATIPMGYAV